MQQQAIRKETKEPKTDTPTEKRTKRSPVSYAVVWAPGVDGDEPKVIEGPSMNELKVKLADPNLEIIAVFKGRRLETKAKRQVSFS